MAPPDPIDGVPTGMSRRTVLALGAGLVGLIGVLRTGLPGVTTAGADSAPGTVPSGPRPPMTPGGLPAFVDPLPVPPVRPTTWITSLTAAPASGPAFRFHSALPATTRTWGYGGQPYLGPTLSVAAGKRFNLVVTNQLGTHPFAASVPSTAICMIGVTADDGARPRISTHLHGGVTEPFSDGHPEDTILPGRRKEHYFDDFSEAKLLWYHDHALGITRLNVAAGLAGALVVRDLFDTGTAKNTLGLPSGRHELPLILQDKLIDLASGDQLYPATRALEFFGDQPLVNGAVAPHLVVDRGVYRFRVLNGANARFFRLGLAADVPDRPVPPMYVIGGDQGLLDATVRVDRLVIGPGERYDVLVDFSRLAPDARITLTNDAATPFPDGGTDLTDLGTPTAITEIMQFVVGSPSGHRSVPKVLRGRVSRPRRLPAIPTTGLTRTVTLLEVEDPADPAGDPIVVLNNLLWDTPAPDAMQQGTTEIWSVVNATVDAHPIHLHLAPFRVLDRRPFDVAGYLATPRPPLGTRWNPAPSAFLVGTASPARPEEAGWKDTVVAHPGEVTRIAVVVPTRRELGFDPDAPFVNQQGKQLRGYAWHCHILEHEDCDMMVPLRITTGTAVGR